MRMVNVFGPSVTRVLGTLATAALISTPGLAAQGGVVTGRVTDVQTGDLIVAAQVHIANLELGVLTQENGRYLIQNVPAGAHEMTVVMAGYHTVQDTVIIRRDRGVEQNFAMSALVRRPEQEPPARPPSSRD